MTNPHNHSKGDIFGKLKYNCRVQILDYSYSVTGNPMYEISYIDDDSNPILITEEDLEQYYKKIPYYTPICSI